MGRTALGLLAIAAPFGLPAADAEPANVRRDLRVHDPSTIVRCGSEYWFFSTGPGIKSHHSKDLKQWTPGPRVFDQPPGWTGETVPGNRGSFWAPDVIAVTNQYFLYYSVSTWGKNHSAIGLATNPTLDPAAANYRWTDRGVVVQSRAADDFNAIDPCVTRDAEGRLWLGFGSFWSGIKLIELDPATGLRIATNSPMYSLAYYRAIEAPFLWRHGSHYYLFVNWDLCCRGTNSTYNIRVGRSAKITGPYLDRNGVDMRQGGGTLFLDTHGTAIGPGHAGIIADGTNEWFSCHIYDRDRAGLPVLAVKRLKWEAGWPKVEP